MFHTAAGHRLLKLISLMTVITLRYGGTPLRAVLAMADLLISTDKLLGAEPDMLDNLFDSLLAELDDDRRGAIEGFFRSVQDDQSLLEQLRPSRMALFDPAVLDRDGVRYGSVLSRSDPPRIRQALSVGISPTAQLGYAWYSVCWRLAAQMKTAPVLSDQAREAIRFRWPELDLQDNDGMVPTLSQVHGHVIRCVGADHLDVLGHFGDPVMVPPSYDWFNTGTGFEAVHFRALWTDIALFLQKE